MRQCGACQLCCKLLPIRDLGKPANKRCQHQRFRKGCSIYERRPKSCRVWGCGWLWGADTEDFARPDKSHLVIDLSPEFVTINDAPKMPRKFAVIQVWIDPRFPSAHEDNAFRAYVAKYAAREILTLIRYSADEAYVLIPPFANDGKEWLIKGGRCEAYHTPSEIQKGLREAGFNGMQRI